MSEFVIFSQKIQLNVSKSVIIEVRKRKEPNEMLLEFSIINYMSIKDEVKISFVAQKNSDDDATGVPLKDKKVLKYMGMFGPNGSGKTNIFIALKAFFQIVQQGKRKDEESLRYEEKFDDIVPYEFSDTKNEPTKFEVIFAIHETIYKYKLILTSKEIFEERLSKYDEKKKRYLIVFKRLLVQADKYKWSYGTSVSNKEKDELKKIQKWSNNKTFLYAGAREENKLLSPIYEWFTNNYFMGFGNHHSYQQFTAEMMFEDEEEKMVLLSLMKKMDFAMEDIEVTKDDDDKEFVVKSCYKINDKQYKLPFWLESFGTQKVFGLLCVLNLVLQSNGRLFFDELEASLHPDIVEKIMCLFEEEETQGQLLFSSHYDSLMDLLNRDQIIFVEKNYQNFSTQVSRMSDYHGIRKDLSKRKAYRSGVFGALPFVED